ncbi:MAG: hypothetical protein KAH95_01475 [Spirochaetales bacterium]|nr:hypothetical protein [Spirochaetales bacterium]
MNFIAYGIEISLIEKPGVKGVDEGKILLLNEKYTTPMYMLKDPWLVDTDLDSFYIQYSSKTDISLELYLGKENIKEVHLPGSEGPVRYQIPLVQGNIINGFRVMSIDPVKENKIFKILGVGIEKFNSGFSVINSNGLSVTVISEGFKITAPGTYLFADLSEKADLRFSQVRVSFTYNYTGNEEVAPELVLFSDNHNVSFGLNPRNGGTEVHFYSNSIGFVPTGIAVKNSDPDFSVMKIYISSFSTLASFEHDPVPADIGTMLNYKKSAWRRNDWEVFSWNLFPDILVMDYRDYALQAASLKRLSFFVEKQGFAGNLVDNETLSKLHGWNAHDYRAKDLAAFFSIAKEQNFILNPEEHDLESILLSNHIITKTDTGYDPVSGGILSYSMESSSRLRRLFITHEGYHGIFFSDQNFVSEVKIIWDGLDDTEKQFWYDFLAWKRYDIDNPYLVVNEFMAYLMQQRIEDIESYYKDYIIPKYLIAFPDDIEKMNEFLLNYPDHFLENAKKVEHAAYSLNSINAGELRCLY